MSRAVKKINKLQGQIITGYSDSGSGKESQRKPEGVRLGVGGRGAESRGGGMGKGPKVRARREFGPSE